MNKKDWIKANEIWIYEQYIYEMCETEFQEWAEIKFKELD